MGTKLMNGCSYALITLFFALIISVSIARIDGSGRLWAMTVQAIVFSCYVTIPLTLVLAALASVKKTWRQRLVMAGVACGSTVSLASIALIWAFTHIKLGVGEL